MTTTKSPRNRLLILLAVATAIATVVALSVGGAASPSSSNVPKLWTETRSGELVFFAVLEGLYRDGVKDDDVDLIIPPGESGKPRFDQEHFVYACPLAGNGRVEKRAASWTSKSIAHELSHLRWQLRRLQAPDPLIHHRDAGTQK